MNAHEKKIKALDNKTDRLVITLSKKDSPLLSKNIDYFKKPPQMAGAS